MSQGKDVTVRVAALDGVWETLGTDRARGVWPENVSLSADRWGPSSASMDLRRDPGAAWPDIGAFTPIEVEVGGVKVWSGRVKETPARDGSDRVLSLQCEGWQFHLDDDQYERRYVSTRLGEFKDMRSVLTAQLAANSLASVGAVGSDGGIMLSYPNGTSQQTGLLVGAVLDLGPDSASWAKRVVVTWKAWGGGGASQRFIIRGSDVPENTWTGAGGASGMFEDIYISGTVAGPTTTPGTFATARRYLQLILNYNGTNAVAAGADVFVQITDVKVFADTAYESGNASVLKASQVVSDALDRATVMLSSDRSQIATTSFSIPELAFDDPRTPRQVIDGVNAYHNYTTAVDVDRRVIFRPQESAPQWEVGAWSGMEFEDASANSGEDIYNRVLVTGQTPAGEPLRVERLQPSAVEFIGQPANRSADVDTSDWTASGGTISRDTGIFDTAPASFLLSTSGIDGIAYAHTGVVNYALRAGVTYRLSFRLRARQLLGALMYVIHDGPWVSLFSNMVALGEVRGIPAGGWTTYTLDFSPQQDVASYSLEFAINTAYTSTTAIANLDTISITRRSGTIIDRRGFRRTMTLPVSSALPSDGAAATQIGDIWLAAHKTTPFRGSMTLTGDSLRDVLTGDSVALERLLLAPQALIRFSDRLDPDTGAHGRDGRLASVTYTSASDQASVAIDSSRNNIESLLSRLAVISG